MRVVCPEHHGPTSLPWNPTLNFSPRGQVIREPGVNQRKILAKPAFLDYGGNLLRKDSAAMTSPYGNSQLATERAAAESLIKRWLLVSRTKSGQQISLM